MTTIRITQCDGPTCNNETKELNAHANWIRVVIQKEHEYLIEQSKQYDLCSYDCLSKLATRLKEM